MSQIALKMQLKPGFEQEYRRRHDAIWPELAELLVAAGVTDYWIFLDEETGILFATHRLADGHTADALPEHPVVKRWWASMVELMEVNADNSPVCVPLKPMFHLA